MSASDSCGPVGPTFTSLTLAFAPGELSTMLYYGAPPADPYGMSAVSSRVLDTNDLPCGPLDKDGNWWVQDGSPTGYQPLVGLPTKLQQMVSAWSSCHGNAFQGQDPPRTLSPGTRLTPEPTTVHTNPQPTPAAPSPPIPSFPVETGAGAAQPLHPNPATVPKGTVDPIASPSWTTTSSVVKVAGDDPGVSGGAAAGAKAVDPPQLDPANPANPENPLPQSSLAIVVQGQTITNNAAPVTVGGTVVAYQAGSIRVNNDVQPYPAAENSDAANASPVTVGGLTFSAVASIAHLTDGQHNNIDSNAMPANDPGAATYLTISGHTITVQANGIVVAGKTLHPGDPGTTVAGSPISLGSSEFVIGHHTETFQPATTTTTLPSQITVNGEPISLGQDSIIIDGTTIKPGDPIITIHGQPVSVGASEVAVGGVTTNLALTAAAIATFEPSYTTLNGETMTLVANDIAIEGKTLKPGDSPISIHGKLISLESSDIVIGSITASVELSGAATTAAPSYITVNGETIAVEASDVVIKGSTLNVGNPGITIDGKMVSLGSSDIVVGGITEAIKLPWSAAMTSSSSYITFGGETVAVGTDNVVIDGATLTPGGPALNLDGTTMSLGSSVLIIGTQTTQLSLRAAVTSSDGSGEGIGAMIMTGLGGIGGEIMTSPSNDDVSLDRSGNESNNVVPFVGEGTTRFRPVTITVWLFCAILLGALVF